MLARNLCDFEQADLAVVVNDRATLDVGLGLVRGSNNISSTCRIETLEATETHLVSKLHEEFSLAVLEMLEDLEVDVRAEVVDVRYEHILLACSETDEKPAVVISYRCRSNLESRLTYRHPANLSTGRCSSWHRRCHHGQVGTIAPCRYVHCAG